ncbi:hypothetical protein MLD38_020672 [Melastoma candidum]|uniref:Uncharacterized protein n=1 Tax=Melastoma candidum TaxID=119954 RepID=A0ACB9QDR1_9MYRT|nr:hypothetical protein MLD38_020672 [Melastoma candidum]
MEMSAHDCTSLDLEYLGLIPKPCCRGQESPAATETPRILVYLSSSLEKTARKNEKSFRISKAKDAITIFHSTRAPSVSIRQYLERVYKYSGCSASCFVLVYLYINRFLHRTRVSLTYLNVHRLLITSTLVASKFLDDVGYNNAYFAKVGGISTEEINRLEKNFLFNIDFRLHVTVEVFEECCLQLEMEADEERHQVEHSKICGIRECWPRREDPKHSTAMTGFSCKAM